ncbi:MAG: hypothetical protein ACRD8A_10770 [Candidatus Acidiferrales bacterium]
MGRAALLYNVGLFVAGALGFVAYALAIDRCIDLRAPGDWEITIFTTIFQAFAYMVMIGVANLCYYLGPLSERIVRPKNLDRYRKVTFRLGFWFSVLLPFAPSIFLFIVCTLQQGEDKRIILELVKALPRLSA